MDVSIILLNYNSSDYTVAAVESIVKHTSELISYELIVVDNASTVQEFYRLQTGLEKTNVKLIRSEVNLGFNGGNQVGLHSAMGRYVLFLNNDTILLNDLVCGLHAFMEVTSDCGLCCAEMKNSDGSSHHAFNYFPTLSRLVLGRTMLSWFRSKQIGNPKRSYQNPVRVDFVTGACAFVRKSALEKIGGLDTNYFLFCEEEDLALSLEKAGYSTYFVPDVAFIHYKSGSMQHGHSLTREYYISLSYYLVKHYGRGYALIYKLLLLPKLLLKSRSDHENLRLALQIFSKNFATSSLRFNQSA